MKLTVEVIVDVHPLEDDTRVGMKEARTALIQGIGEALKHAENRGFNHEHSDWVGIHIDTVDVSSAPILRKCHKCRAVFQLKKESYAQQNEWYCDECAEQLPEEPTEVPCKFCQVLTLLGEAHRHDEGWVCAGCWDERLRASE